MFDSCQQSTGNGPRCADVAEKLAQLFGWRQTYKVEKLQRTLSGNLHIRTHSVTKVPLGPRSSDPTLVTRKLLQRGTDSCGDTWVAVHNLQSQSGGGILDPDDKLNDVADDRETIIANFEDGDGVHHGGGDGASGSSVGTGSPDIFHGSDKYPPPYSRTDIEVTGEQIASGLSVPLQVRRGSEPALNQLIGCGPQPNGPLDPRPPIMQDPSKRWSAAPIILDDHLHDTDKNRNGHTNGYLSPEWTQEDDQNDDGSHFQRITRDGSNRLSMQFLGDGAGYRWAEAAERAAINGSSKNRLPGTTGSKSLPREHKRKEPLGQANTSASSSINFDLESIDVETIIIRNEPGQLGLHVVPDYDRMGKEKGLLVQGIEPGGRIDHDGKLAVYDRIIEINNQPLLNIPFQRVQEIFKNAQSAPELRLKVIKHRSGLDVFPNRPPPPVYPRPHDIARLFDDKENVGMVEVEEKLVTNTKVATVSPTKKIPSSSRNPKSLLTANTRKIGKKIELELVKGSHGLGFSITTRDNPAGGNCPIYIKNILPKGAAVEDGRLKPGDRLLEVNGIEMTGKTQAEAVTVLRNAPSGSCVRIVVSRQEDVIGPVLPRVNDQPDSLNKSRASSPSAPAIPPLPSSHEMSGKIRDNSDRTGSVAKIISQFQEAAKSGNSSPLDTKSADDSAVFPWKHREILTFNIPVHDSEKAGLGVSVKGKTTTSHSSMGSSDLGIFVKSVLHGGAASRDKRLRTNDQLLNVNGVSLLHQSNSDAMETLRRAMLHTEGPVPGSITLTIARRVPSPAPPHVNNSGRDSASSLLTNSSGPETFVGNSSGENESSQTTDNSGTSEKSGNTVIFLPYSKHSDISGHSLNSSNHSNSHSFGNLDSWNPVIDRITGQTSNPIPSQLRNESYYRATHDQTWNGSFNQDLKLTSPTVNLPSGETILIENEYVTNYPSTPSYTTKDNPKVFKNSDVVRNTSDEKVSVTMVNSDQASDSNPVSSDATYASQLSLENPAGFSRDAFGRQSMSEKRHATLDAKNTDTYQRNKKLREEREKEKDKKSSGPGIIRVGSVESIISLNRSPGNNSEEADKLGQLGPSLGMKKSSSLESLQTMVQGIQMREDADPAYSYRGNQPGPKVIRGRGCDDSFRAAVDINYGKSIGNPNTTEESHAKKHWLLDPPSSTSNCDNDNIDVGFLNARGGLRQSSLNAGDIKNKTKKKPSLLKGIGSMFRFGKHRKTLDTVPSLDDHIITAHEINPISERVDVNIQLQSNETPHLPTIDNKQEQLAQNTQHQAIQLPHNGQHIHQHNPHHLQHNPQSQYRPLMHQQQMKRMQNHNTNENASNSAAHIRSQHVQELRAMHQKRHAERHGQYISEEREDQYERAIRQRLEHSDPGHGRSASYEVYNDIQRPGSRQGISEPHRFSHYVNYDEIQHQLSRRQQHYHSQRQPQRENTQRPMSNFYEYESVQSFMHGPTRLALSPATQQHSSSNSENEVNAKALSRQTQFDKTASISKQHFIQHARPYQPPPPPVNDVYQQHNSNRQYQRYVSNHNQRNVHRHNGNTRGPFITQVTIEDQTQKSAGSRV